MDLESSIYDGSINFGPAVPESQQPENHQSFAALNERRSRASGTPTQRPAWNALQESLTDPTCDLNNMLDITELGVRSHFPIESIGKHPRVGYQDSSIDGEIMRESRIVELDDLQIDPRPYPNVTEANESGLLTAHFAPPSLDRCSEETSLLPIDREVKGRSQPISKADWVKHRPLITRLYARMKLCNVMRHMEREHGFSAK